MLIVIVEWCRSEPMDLECEQTLMKSDDEMGREKPSGTGYNHHKSKSSGGGGGSGSTESRRMVDITRDKPIKVAVRVVVPVRDHPKFNFVGKLLGPKGNSLKRLQEDTMCKMAVLGRGSMKDRHKEEELRASGDPKFQHLSEELHVEISAFATPAEAHARIAYALAEVRRFLVPDYNDDIRQEQMWEMQVLQSSQRNNNKEDDGEIQGEMSDDRLSGEGGDLEADNQQEEHPALRGAQPGPETPPSNDTTSSATPSNGTSLSPTNGNGTVNSISGVGRKRPLLTGGLRTSMTPTKRTVMSLLARARAAQAKQIPPTFNRPPPERSGTMVPLLREDYLTGAVNLNLI